ncbi:MAG: (d)CMP kinase [bacterium]|nr:(d)CMP kinase [bacterium]
MKITLGGRAGSGKSFIAKALAEKYHLKHYSTGDMMREIAMGMGYTIEAFSSVTPEETDRELDGKTEKIGKTEDNFIFDSRLAFHFIPDAIKVFLDVSYEEGARRIFLKPRESEAKVETEEELARRNKERWETDRKRYIKIYNIDLDKRENYDAYIDTTKLTREEVLREVERIIPTL